MHIHGHVHMYVHVCSEVTNLCCVEVTGMYTCTYVYAVK